jgi:uncharacterized Rmd1/YagE family protein
MRCVAYATAESYRLKDLITFFSTKRCKTKRFREMLYVQGYQDESDLFIFAYGCVVFWSSTPEVEKQILKNLSSFEVGPAVHHEMDELRFDIDWEDQKPLMQNNHITLTSDNMMERAAVSYGLSQSVKLSMFEITVQTVTSEIEIFPQQLATHGKIFLSRKDIARKMGRIFLVRSSINLHTDLLDTPEFFWDYPEYESFYKMATKDLDVSQRTEILNKRLDMIQELYAMLTGELQHWHSSLLEWIIIILISVEIGMFLIKEFLV